VISFRRSQWRAIEASVMIELQALREVPMHSRSEGVPIRRLWAGPASLRETVWIGSAEGLRGATLMLTCR
jgi:hypothetical protein